MSATIQRFDDDFWILRVRGILRKSELETCQARYASKVQPDGKAKMLILLEAFEGWERGAAWDDLEFFMTHGDTITKMAIVGDPRLEIEAMASVGAGIRETRVRYFPPQAEPEARAWLG
jgi:hypothetical protein